MRSTPTLVSKEAIPTMTQLPLAEINTNDDTVTITVKRSNSNGLSQGNISSVNQELNSRGD